MVAVVNKRRLQYGAPHAPSLLFSPLLSSPASALFSPISLSCILTLHPTFIFPLLSYKSDKRHSEPDLALTASRSHLVGPPIPTARASASGSSRHSKATLILSCYHLNLTATQALDFFGPFLFGPPFSFSPVISLAVVLYIHLLREQTQWITPWRIPRIRYLTRMRPRSSALRASGMILRA